MNYRTQWIAVVVTTALLVPTAHADFKISIPNVEVTSDGVNPTTGSFPILLEVDGAGAPNVSAPISSYNFQLDVTSVSGGVTSVTSMTGSAGDLFSTITSQEFQFQAFTFGSTPLGYSEGASTLAQPNVPAPSTLNTPVVLTNVSFSIPAGQVGSFTVDFVPGSLEFFDDSFPVAAEYGGVTSTGGTITAIPEPSPFVMLTLICGVTVIGKTLRRRYSRRATENASDLS